MTLKQPSGVVPVETDKNGGAVAGNASQLVRQEPKTARRNHGTNERTTENEGDVVAILPPVAEGTQERETCTRCSFGWLRCDVDLSKTFS